MSNIPDFTEYPHKGYTLRQFNDVWHYQIINADGKTVLTVNCSQKLTEVEAIEIIDEFLKPKAPETKVCPTCGKEFAPSRTQIYCSKKCRKLKEAERSQANRDKEKVEVKKLCEVCKKEFVTSRGNQKFCSKKCKQISHSEYSRRYYLQTKGPAFKRICRCCGKQFTPCDRYRVYCSEICQLKGKYSIQYDWRNEHKKLKPKYTDALCWHCTKACGGCSWSRNLIPIEGWKAKEIKNASYSVIKSYKVIECPEFEEGR
jgi:predicted nucleic acid-binding Zn ribbon protein